MPFAGGTVQPVNCHVIGPLSAEKEQEKNEKNGQKPLARRYVNALQFWRCVWPWEYQLSDKYLFIRKLKIGKLDSQTTKASFAWYSEPELTKL